MIQRALLSVSDKEGIVAFAQRLAKKGVEIVSTGGTARVLLEAGVAVTPIERVTNFPECFSGRLKTLHPMIHGGILFRRGQDDREADKLGMKAIDLVVVNLYPFESTLRQAQGDTKLLELIDIGGPAMLRSAAKNFESVTVVCDPADYDRVAAAIEERENTTLSLRKELAAKVFLRTAAYDAAITEWLSDGANHGVVLTHGATLRYGENPHQWGKLYQAVSCERRAVSSGVAGAEVLQGKEMSYLNYLDADAAWQCVQDFSDPTAVFLKHASPCGVASHASILEAFRRGYDSDPRSAFGVIIAVNRPCDAPIVQEILDRKIFVEILIAPEFSEEALTLLKSKPNMRVLAVRGKTLRDAQPHSVRLPEEARQGRLEGCGWAPPIGPADRPSREALRAEWQGDVEYRSISGGVLVQSPDTKVVTESDLKVVTKRKPTKGEIRDLLFAATVVKHVKSNAMVLAKGQVTVGIGPGQTSRVDATEIAVRKAATKAKGAAPKQTPAASLQGTVMASDAFLPFPDALEEAARVGIAAVVQPGGSIRDKEVIAAADKLKIAMVFTGVRAFRH